MRVSNKNKKNTGTEVLKNQGSFLQQHLTMHVNDPTGFCGTIKVISKVINTSVHRIGHLVPTLPLGSGQVIVASTDFQEALRMIKHGSNSRTRALI